MRTQTPDSLFTRSAYGLLVAVVAVIVLLLMHTYVSNRHQQAVLRQRCLVQSRQLVYTLNAERVVQELTSRLAHSDTGYILHPFFSEAAKKLQVELLNGYGTLDYQTAMRYLNPTGKQIVMKLNSEGKAYHCGKAYPAPHFF